MQHIVVSGAVGVLFATLTALPARAGEVTVSGGFVSYAGPTWDYVYPATTVSTRIETNSGTVLSIPLLSPLPGDPDGLYASTGIGLGSLSLDAGGSLPPATGLQFWQSFDGSKDGENAIAFSPGPAVVVAAGEEFLLGTFTLANGGWFGSMPLSDGSTYTYPESAFGFVLTTHSAEAVLDGHVFAGTIRFHVTGTASSDPELDADYFYVLERTDLGYVGAYESYNTPTGSNTGTIALYGRIGSLEPTRFADADGVVLAAALPVAPVPLPGTLGLALAGSSILLGRRLPTRRAPTC